MIKLLLVTPNRNSLGGLASALKINDDVELFWAGSGGKALAIAAETHLDLVVTDECLGDVTGLELAEKMLSVNPMINCAAVSSLSSKEFHEASEGLGLLAQLPALPGKEQAEELLQQIMDLKGRLAGI
jgi:YesN/AraC family two-component response regulator